MVSSKSLDMDLLCIRAVDQSHTIHLVAVAGVPYFICCADNPRLKLACNGPLTSQYRLSDADSSGQIFTLAHLSTPGGGNFCSIAHEGQVVSSREKTKCLLVLVPDYKEHRWVQILTYENDHDSRPHQLTHDNESLHVAFKLQNDLGKDIKSTYWILQPAYDIKKSLAQSTVNEDSLLLKLERKVPSSNVPITLEQCGALYKFYETREEDLMLIEDDNHFLGALSSMTYCTGIILTAEQGSSLEVQWAEGYELSNPITRTMLPDPGKNSTVKIGEGESRLIKPKINGSAIPKKFGAMLVGWQKAGLLGNGSFTWLLGNGSLTWLTLSELLKSATLIRPDFAVDIKGNRCSFVRIDTSPFVNSGAPGYVAKAAAEASADALKPLVDRLASSIEAHGNSIEKASCSVSKALVESSKNISQSLSFCAETMAASLNYAAQTFQNTLNFITYRLSHTALIISDDMEKNTAVLAKSLDRASKNLHEALQEASNNLSNGLYMSSVELKEATKELSKSIDGASDSFDKAFDNLSKALTSSSENMKKGAEIASQHFLKGTEQLNSAAGKLAIGQAVGGVGAAIGGVGTVVSKACILM